MTGYGHGQAAGAGVRVDVEISSVNRKQLDVQVGLPRAWQSLEAWVTGQLARAVSRGRVSVQVTVARTGVAGAGRVVICDELVAEVARAARRAARRAGLPETVAMGDMLRIPGVVVVKDEEPAVEQAMPLLEKAMNRALSRFGAMRRREGVNLHRDLAGRLAGLARHVDAIAARAPSVVEHYRRALRERIGRAIADTGIDDERLEKEVILFADRCDIAEELARLRSHFQQARALMKQTDPAGRPLDFLAQEMFREINTVGAKAADHVIAAEVVQFKTELERFREQVQNIE
mgnify:CR=1 FL=1